jgi:hypothetical protein
MHTCIEKKNMDEINRSLAQQFAQSCSVRPLPLEGAGEEEKPEEPIDPAELGTLVRALASQAHKTLTQSTTGKLAELHELHQQFDRLHNR